MTERGRPSVIPSGDRSPLTIKGVAPETRQALVRGAAQRGETQAEWLARAVANQAGMDTRESILPPADRGILAVSPRPVIPGTPDGQTGLTDLVPLAGVLSALAEARAAGLPVSAALFREVAGLLRDRTRAHRGKPLLRRRIGQTVPAIGQTEGRDG